jgi:transposase
LQLLDRFSIGSSTVQLHYSLVSRRVCVCSEAGFSSQNGNSALGCTTEEQRPVVRFLWAKGLHAKDIHKEMFPVYGRKCLSRKAVHNWAEKFSQGRSEVSDNPRPGRPVEIATEATVQWAEELIRADRRITTDSLATALGCSCGLAYRKMHDRLKFRKVCVRWMPRELKVREKMHRVGLSVVATSLTVCR